MVSTTVIVVFGAGSISFGLYGDIFSWGELLGSTLALVDVWSTS